MSQLFASQVRFFEDPAGGRLFSDWRDLAEEMAQAKGAPEVSRHVPTIHSRLSAIAKGRTGLSDEYRELILEAAKTRLVEFEQREQYVEKLRKLLLKIQSEPTPKGGERLARTSLLTQTKDLWVFVAGHERVEVVILDLLRAAISGNQWPPVGGENSALRRLTIVTDGAASATQAWLGILRSAEGILEEATSDSMFQDLILLDESNAIRVLSFPFNCPTLLYVSDPFQSKCEVLTHSISGLVQQPDLARGCKTLCDTITAQQLGEKSQATDRVEIGRLKLSDVESELRERLIWI